MPPSLPTGIYHNCSCTYGHPRVKGGCFVSKSCVEIPRCREQKPSSPGEQNILSLQSRLEKDTGTGGASSPNSPLAIACLVGRLCSSDQPGCADACYCSDKLHKKCRKLFSFLFSVQHNLHNGKVLWGRISVQGSGYITCGYSLSCHLCLYLSSPQTEKAWTAIKAIEK